MGFFARPNLDDIQFRQLTGTTLTLSGQTRIASPTGLTLTDGAGGYRPIIATGGTQFDVLTLVGGKIILQPSSASGGTGVYTLASPTTCTVGGLPSGSAISGCTLSCILEKILVPTVSPTLTAPSATFTVSTISNPYEIGTILNVMGCTSLNLGCINPQYSSACGKRSNGAISHTYVDFNGISCTCFGSNLNCTRSLPAYPVTAGIRTAYGSISYCAGVQPKDSSGANYSTPLASGTTAPIGCTVCGLYPYFYGKIASGGAPAGGNRPAPTTTICSCIIAGCGKTVVDSNVPIYINFNSGSDDYIWFAIPSTCTPKTSWYLTALNNGAIGGAVSAGGNLFPAYCSVTSISTACWSNQTYQIYVSNYQTGANAAMTIS